MTSIADARRGLQTQLFPRGVPRLWCPPLTHFCAAASPDAPRTCAHLRHLSPHVRGLLVPGSTGEGWDMADGDVRGVLEIVLATAAELGLVVLIGILKTDLPAMLTALDNLTGELTHPAAVGITVCPPRGAELTADQLDAAMVQILERGHPTALYQLPQVTQNELSPATVARLASEYENFILFKDTSGRDVVAQAGVDLGGVFLVRGSEQQGYAAWTRAAGGPYDGFLLSTANVFAADLDRLLALQAAGEFTAAAELSQQLESIVQAAFALVAALPDGNPFTNANKLLDHAMAHGSEAVDVPPPLLYSGRRLPAELVSDVVQLLARHDRLPPRGYLAEA